MLLVLVSHAHVPHLRAAANVGVTVFFVLSGFLITALLLEETDRTGRVSFAGFYARRARRLLPALLVTVAGVAVLELAAGGYASLRSFVGTLLYSNNWLMVGDPARDALSHTWSLSIEEQFYVAAPLVVLALHRRPRVLATVCGLGALGVLLLRVAIVGDATQAQFRADLFPRVYYGTDVRADALLVGVGLAVLVRAGLRGHRAATATGAVVIAACCLAHQYSIGYGVLLPTAVAVGTVPLVLSAISSPLLDRQWLRWLGERSYGAYLYHWPLVILADRAGWSWQAAVPVVAAAVLLAAASYRWLEQPIRRRSGRRPNRSNAGVGDNRAEVQFIQRPVETLG